MTGWPIVPLAKVAEVNSGAGFPISYQGEMEEQFPFYKVSDMNLPNNTRLMKHANNTISEQIRRTLRATAFAPGSIIFPKIGAAIATNKKRIMTMPSCVDNNVMVVTPDKSALDSEFLYYLFEKKDLSDFASKANPPSIRKSDVERWSIPLPPLAEQRRIVDILNRASGIRRLRREAQEKARQIIPALFVAMFGDPAAAAGAVHSLEDLAEVVSGVTKGRRFNGVQPVLVPYLRVANVQAGYLDLSEIKTIEALPEDVERLALRRDDVLLTEGGDFDKLGRGALWEANIPNIIHQNHVFRVRAEQTLLDPHYLVAYLQTTQAKQYFLRCAKRTTNLASINMTQLKQLPVPCPPLALQRAFAERVAAVKGITAQQERMAEASERLMASLMARVFDGERPA